MALGKHFKYRTYAVREEKIDDPQAQALFEVTAEVMGGLQKAFEHYENQSEKAWR